MSFKENGGSSHNESSQISEDLSSFNSASLSEEANTQNAPVILNMDTANDDIAATTRRRRSSTQISGSISQSFAEQALETVRRTLSGTSSFESNNISRQNTGYNVKDIYGDMDNQTVEIRRQATRNTILNSLARRVQSASEMSEKIQTGLPRDEEEEVDDMTSLKSQQKSVYEEMPDTSVPTKDYGQEFSGIDPELVTWDGPDDPAFPRNWSTPSKVWQTTIVAFYTLISPMTSSICSPAMNEIAEEFGMKSDFLKSFSVSIMVLAWALGPLIIAPISESDKIGRRPVLNISIWINLFFNLGCGFSKTTAQLCIFRFLGGLGGCAALNVGAGTLADLWDNDQRLIAMSFYSICPTLGPIFSPIISSFVVQNLDWRWCFHILTIFNGAVAIIGTIFFRETYSPTLLYRKAEVLKKETGNQHLHTIYQIADGETKMGQFLVTISRPIMLLTHHPMIIGLGSFMAFTYGFMYLMIVTFPAVYKGKYHMKTGISGLMYIPMGIGFTLGIIFFTIVIRNIYDKLTARNGGVAKPEYRLPCLVCSGIGIPVGLIWYGWSAEKELHWIMPSIGTAIFGFSLIAVFQTIQNYLIDMNTRFAASSIAAAAVFRSLFGFSFPLFASKMYQRLGYGWGNTLCAFLALGLGVPFPLFCLKYGERLRLWANAKMDAQQAKRDARNLEKLKLQNEAKNI